MKILMCNKFHFMAGGTEVYVFDLCQGLSELGHTVIDFSTQNIHNLPSTYSEYFVQPPDLSNNLKNRHLFGLRTAFKFIYSLESARNIERLIDKYKPNIAHIHNIYHHLSFSVLDVLRRKKIPVVMTLHDYKIICPNYSLFTGGKLCEKCKGNRYYNAIRYKCLKDSYLKSALACLEMYFYRVIRNYVNNVNLFIAPSEFIRNKIISFGISSNRIRYLPHAINLDAFTPNFESGKYILYFGILSVKKGVGLLLEALKAIDRTIPVKIIGEGQDKEKLIAWAKNKGLNNVEFLGYKPREELISFIRNSLFVVVPSLWCEVAGLNIYEAFACGKCVLGAKTGGIPELIEHGVSGLLFNPYEDNDLRNKIRYLVDNPEQTTRLGRNGLEKISRFNNRVSHYKELLEIYTQEINNHRN